METISTDATHRIQKVKLAKYVGITWGITLACSVVTSVVQAVIGTSLSVVSIVALIASIHYCGQKFFKDHARVPLSGEAVRYATLTTLAQAVMGIIGLTAVAVSGDKVASDPMFWKIMVGVGAMMLIVCYLCARYILVSAAKKAASAAAAKA